MPIIPTAEEKRTLAGNQVRQHHIMSNVPSATGVSSSGVFTKPATVPSDSRKQPVFTSNLQIIADWSLHSLELHFHIFVILVSKQQQSRSSRRHSPNLSCISLGRNTTSQHHRNKAMQRHSIAGALRAPSLTVKTRVRGPVTSLTKNLASGR